MLASGCSPLASHFASTPLHARTRRIRSKSASCRLRGRLEPHALTRADARIGSGGGPSGGYVAEAGCGLGAVDTSVQTVASAWGLQDARRPATWAGPIRGSEALR